VPGRRALFLAVCCLGISAFITQVTLMRELLGIFSGNELVFGIVLGNWLLLTGIGATLGRTSARLRDPVAVLVPAQILIAVLPLVDVLVLRTLHDAVFLRGAAVGVTGTMVSCFVLLAPYCLIAGYLLTLASRILASNSSATSIGQVYFLDNVGDVIGGLLFSFVLIHLFDTFGILYTPAMLNCALACMVAFVFKKRVLLLSSAAATVLLAVMALGYDLDRISTRMEYAGRLVVHEGTSPYGRLVVTRSARQYDFILNGVVLFTTHDIEDVEETVHFAMAQQPGARCVLLISGGVSGTAREILKYPHVARVDYVELDPQILEVGRRFLPDRLADPRIHVINTDGRLFVRQTGRRYDVVIVDVPDPSTSQINRFYTREFLTEVRRILRPGGVISFALGRYENYLSPELADLIGTAHRTVKQAFENVVILPAGHIFFLASDSPLTLEIAARIEEAGIATQLVNRHYLTAVLTPDRLAAMHRAISEAAPVNRDFSPVLYYHHLRYWLSRFTVSFWIPGAVLLLILLVCLHPIRPVTFALFTTGLTASALEVVLLVGFQILYGCVYHRVGLIIALFMVGLGIGSFTMNRLLPGRRRRDLAWLEVAMGMYAAALPFAMVGLGRFDSPVSQAAIPVLALVLGVGVGLAFPLAGKVDFSAVTTTAARLYTADYLGAAVGALLVSTLLIPVMGVTAVCLLAAGLNILSGLILLVTGRETR